MSRDWEWDNRDEMKHMPQWVEVVLVIVGLPVVLVSVVVILFPVLDLTNAAILFLIIAFVVYITKDSYSKGKIVNRQTIRVKDRIITYKVNDEGRSYVLINVMPDSLSINRNTHPHTLEWLDAETNYPVKIPLIGMSLNNERKLYKLLDKVIVYHTEPSLTSSKH